MPDASPLCAACDRPLRPDDLYCSRCGTATPLNDPDATLVRADSGHSESSEPDREVTAVTAREGEAEQAPLPESATFGERLRHVLGEEYQLISLIGQGGFARVYKAKDRRLDRIVAIKVIRPDMVGSTVFAESLKNEGIALAKLRHPSIIPIYDIRERGGLVYYLMPCVEGTTLATRLDRGRLPPYETRRILSELADALGAAHRAKMVHLDIKPANVFLEGDLGKVLLMDFGIAKAVTDQIDDTAVGPVMGTPEYMSPEQASGSPEIDHRSDIYSLGVLGYRMLTGRPPFLGDTAKEILAKQINEAPVPIRDVNPTIPKDFADAIMRCLDKDPWRRFSTALELRAALDAVTFFTTTGEPVTAETKLGYRGGVVILIGLVALLVGLLAGRALL
jgi:serine/threonine protein kinase